MLSTIIEQPREPVQGDRARCVPVCTTGCPGEHRPQSSGHRPHWEVPPVAPTRSIHSSTVKPAPVPVLSEQRGQPGRGCSAPIAHLSLLDSLPWVLPPHRRGGWGSKAVVPAQVQAERTARLLSTGPPGAREHAETLRGTLGQGSRPAWTAPQGSGGSGGSWAGPTRRGAGAATVHRLARPPSTAHAPGARAPVASQSHPGRPRHPCEALADSRPAPSGGPDAAS